MTRVYHLATQWLAEVGAFILLPLVIYLIVFLALGIEKGKLIELPEWMFVSIILFGESTLKSIAYYKNLMLSVKESGGNTAGLSLKMNREFSVGMFAVVVACVFLALIMVASKNALSLSRSFYWLQILIFVLALARSFGNRIYIGWKTDEGTILTLSEPSRNISASQVGSG